MKRLSKSQIPTHKKKLLQEQGNRCGLCGIDLSKVEPRNVCLDHDHKDGHVRSVLCRNCNGIEGKIYNLANRGKRNRTCAEFLNSVLEYWKIHAYTPDGEHTYHPDHRTPDEKRVARNSKARIARAKKAARKNLKK